MYPNPNPMHAQVRFITLTETLPVRSLSLRGGKAFSECKVPEDELPTAFHLGYEEHGQLIGTASFYKVDRVGEEGKGYQLRLMGVHPAHQHKGVGAAILKAGIAEVLGRLQADYLWCHARAAAYGFYERLGFVYVSAEFEIPVIGTHRTMMLRK